ncbi:MAG: hypothetical protein NC218_01900 [Acetobacter sp.]|nr:hypothetical protein [Acetobacter sp.]
MEKYEHDVGYFWVIAKTVEDIKQKNYGLITCLYKVDNDGNVLAEKTIPTQEEYWKKNCAVLAYKDELFRVSHKYFPHGTVEWDAKEQHVVLTLPTELPTCVIDRVIEQYDLGGDEVAVVFANRYTNEAFKFNLGV